MIAQFTSLLALFCHAAGLLIILYGAFLIIGGVVAGRGPMGLVQGGVLVFLGTWFSGLAG